MAKKPKAEAAQAVEQKFTVASESVAFHLNGAFMRVKKGDVVEGEVAEAVKAAGGTLE